MSLQEQQYEDVLVTQMHSLWFDEPDPAPRKRRSVYSPIFQSPETSPIKTSKYNKDEDSKKNKKWLKKINNVISTYNKPASFKNKDSVPRRDIVISTPFGFNHAGHISDTEMFGVDKLFNLRERETSVLGSLLIPNIPKAIEAEKIQEPVRETPRNEKRLTKGVSSFTTMPIELPSQQQDQQQQQPKIIKRSVSDKSVNSSLLFSRSNSINTLATSASITQSPPPLPPKSLLQMIQQHKHSISGNSLKSLMDLEKYHQRSLSASKSSSQKSKSVSPHSSYLDNSKTSSFVEGIKEEEDIEEEDEELDIPELAEEEMKESYEFPAIHTPHQGHQLNWNSSPMSFMRSSWIYKDESPLQKTPLSAQLSPLASSSESSSYLPHENSSEEDLMQASFKAGKFSRRSRMSLQLNLQQKTTTGSVDFVDGSTVSTTTDLLPPVTV